MSFKKYCLHNKQSGLFQDYFRHPTGIYLLHSPLMLLKLIHLRILYHLQILCQIQILFLYQILNGFTDFKAHFIVSYTKFQLKNRTKVTDIEFVKIIFWFQLFFSLQIQSNLFEKFGGCFTKQFSKDANFIWIFNKKDLYIIKNFSFFSFKNLSQYVFN